MSIMANGLVIPRLNRNITFNDFDMRKRIQWLFLAAALLPFVPSVAQDESVVTLAGNAYVTATSEGGDSKNVYIDEHNCALRNWDSTEDVVSFYFKVEKSGKMNVALQAKGDSKIEVTVLGKKKKIRLDSDDLSRVEVGTFKVKAKEAREGRNPKTGEKITIAASKTPVFTAGKALKDQIK